MGVAGVNGIGFKKRFSVNRHGGKVHLLLSKSNSQFSFYIVYASTDAGFNDPHIAFVVYQTISYNGIEHVHITPLDGKTYTVVDYEHDGVTYRAVQVNFGSSDLGGSLYAIGDSSLALANILV